MSSNLVEQPFRVVGDIHSVEVLLKAYPNLVFNPSDEESLILWKDLIKSATPKNHKKHLTYDKDTMNLLLADELYKLMILRNVLVRTMKELGTSCTKVLLLKSVSEKMGAVRSFSLGGGRRPDTRRLILIYESEAEVTARKRKSCTRRSYKPRKRLNSDGDLLESDFHQLPLMHGDSFQNLFDEDDHDSSMDVASATSSFYSSGDDFGAPALNGLLYDSTSEEDFEVLLVDEFND